MTLRFTFAALLVIAFVGALCGCSPSASRAEAEVSLDTRRLPRAHLVREVFASPASTVYISRETAENTVAAVVQQLAGAGWQQYTSPVSAQADKHGVKIASFKKGSQAVTVFITVTPGAQRQTSVQYAAVKLATDLPFPPGGTAIEYDPDHGRLACVATQPVEKLLVFFDAELVRLGWSVAPSQVGVSRATATGASALYVRDRKTALKLTLDNRDDGTTAVKLKEVPEETLVDEKAKSNEKANVDEESDAPPRD